MKYEPLRQEPPKQPANPAYPVHPGLQPQTDPFRRTSPSKTPEYNPQREIQTTPQRIGLIY